MGNIPGVLSSLQVKPFLFLFFGLAGPLAGHPPRGKPHFEYLHCSIQYRKLSLALLDSAVPMFLFGCWFCSLFQRIFLKRLVLCDMCTNIFSKFFFLILLKASFFCAKSFFLNCDMDLCLFLLMNSGYSYKELLGSKIIK